MLIDVNIIDINYQLSLIMINLMFVDVNIININLSIKLDIFQKWLLHFQAAKCLIGKDYPKPIVDHAEVSKKNIGRMKKSYDASKDHTETTEVTTKRGSEQKVESKSTKLAKKK